MNKELFEEYCKHHIPSIGSYNEPGEEHQTIFCKNMICSKCIFERSLLNDDTSKCSGTGENGVTLTSSEYKELLKTNPEWFI